MVRAVSNHHNIFDVIDCGSWSAQSGSVMKKNKVYMTIPDLVKRYAVLIDVEGVGFSARVKYLLWSHRPLLLVERPYKEYFFEYLKEWVHYIPVKRDLSDLVERAQWCMDHYDEAVKIAEQAYQFAKEHLTREACYKKWDDIIMNAHGAVKYDR